MEQIDIQRYIIMNVVLMENLAMSIDNEKNRNKIRREVDVFKNQSKKLRMMLFKGELNDKLDKYDEWSNLCLELMIQSYECGFEKSISILKAYNNGEIKEESN